MSIRSHSKIVCLNSTSLVAMLSLFFVLYAGSAYGVQKKKVKPVAGVVKSMTVMAIDSPQKNEDYYTISFRVAQMRYRLPVRAKAKYLNLLRESERRHLPVLVWRSREDSDLIIRVEKKKS